MGGRKASFYGRYCSIKLQATPNPATSTHVAIYIILAYIILESHSILMENIGIFK